MLLDRAIVILAMLHDPDVIDVKTKVFDVIGKAARGIDRLATASNVLLVKYLEMCRVTRILHGLEPVGIEIGMDNDAALAVAPGERIVVRNNGSRQWPEIGPVHTQESLHRIARLLDVA